MKEKREKEKDKRRKGKRGKKERKSSEQAGRVLPDGPELPVHLHGGPHSGGAAMKSPDQTKYVPHGS